MKTLYFGRSKTFENASAGAHLSPVLSRNAWVFETNRLYSHVFLDAFYLDIVHVTVLKRFAPLCHWK